jgi:hypothetical protein
MTSSASLQIQIWSIDRLVFYTRKSAQDRLGRRPHMLQHPRVWVQDPSARA